MDKLLDFQVQHVKSLIKSLKEHDRALDASDTGTGKTYSSAAICKELGLKPIVVCPKSVIPDWRDVLTQFEVTAYGIANYELLKNCRFYKNQNTAPSRCPFIKRVKTTVIKKGKKKDKWLYSWNFPKDAILIFDEVHRCKNKKTINSDLLFTATHYPVKILLLSATACDKPENFSLAGYTLGLYDTMNKGIDWINKVGEGHFNPMEGVHKELFPKYASRMRIKDLGALFPNNEVKAKCYDMDCALELQEQYELIKDAVERLKKQEDQSVALGQLIKARMRVEMLKVPTLIKLAKKYREDNKSVAIFVNFTQTLQVLAQELETNCLIFGEQTMEQRKNNIDSFNTDESRIIICNVRAGGVGISLHDKIGKFARVSIISPSWSAQDILQALGRIHRANGKTEVKQRIIFCKNTVEEDICTTIKEKIRNISAMNDGVVDSYEIEGLSKKQETHQLSELENAYSSLISLNMKKLRLEQELKDLINEINSVNFIVEQLEDSK